MTYILLAAGRGTRLHPLTLNYPKTLYRLDKDTTVLKRMVRLIRKYDENALIVIVSGFMGDIIKSEMDNVIIVNNPFYEVTNSVASLWFAREYLDSSNVTVINGDIVVEDIVVEKIITKETDKPMVCIDSSIKNAGDYNVQVHDGTILVMSKELEQYYGEYAGITKLDHESAKLLKQGVMKMVEAGMYDQWYENVMVQMIFNEDFRLYYEDIKDYRWTEIDCVGDMLLAKQIHNNS